VVRENVFAINNNAEMYFVSMALDSFH